MKKEHDFKEYIKDFASIVGLFALIGYFVCFLFYQGYFSYFNISLSLIFWNNVNSFSFIALIAIMCGLPFLVLPILSELYKLDDFNNDKYNYIEKKFVKLLSLLCDKFGNRILSILELILDFLLTYIYMIIYWYLWTKSFQFYLALLFAFIIIIAFYIKRDKIPILKNIFKKVILCIFTLAIISLLLISIVHIGNNNAQQRKYFLVTNDNYVLLYNTNEKAIICKYEEINNEKVKIYNSKYKLIDITNVELSNKKFDNISFE